MITQAHDVTQEQIEHLCAGYRAGVEEPAFSSADQVLLRAAARSARYRYLQRQLGTPSVLLLVALLAVLGSAAAGWFDLAGSHRSVPRPATLTTRADPAAPLRTGRLLPLHSGYLQTTQTAARAFTPPVLLTPTSTPVRTVQKAMLQAVDTISVAQSAADPAQSAAIDLNAPGALDALRRSRPEDYRRIVVILAGITRHAQGDVPHWLQANFDARDVVYQPLWLTSFPPKRRLSFSLEGQRYRAVLTITDQGARVLPVDDTAQCRASPGGVVCGDPAPKGQP
jgi:hypothetical protein